MERIRGEKFEHKQKWIWVLLNYPKYNYPLPKNNKMIINPVWFELMKNSLCK